MASEVKPPGTLASDSSYGDPFTAWSSPSNASSENGSCAVATSFAGSPLDTQYLKATNFGFAIPTGSSIDGILVRIKRACLADLGSGVVDSRVRLVKGGTIQTTDKASGFSWPTSLGFASYGGASDVWSGSWTAEDINASGFGVVISATIYDIDGGTTADIDFIEITVYYTEGGGGGGSGTSGNLLLLGVG